MATTTNYGWTTPDDTALVKDGAAAIRTLGTSIDTTTKNLNPSTTLGDIEYRSSSANVNTRLGIGSNGNVLTVAGGVPTWAAPAGGGGKVLQVVSNLNTTDFSSTSTSPTDSGLTATITPTSSTSKILVMIMQTIEIYRESGTAGFGAGIDLLRGNTLLLEGPGNLFYFEVASVNAFKQLAVIAPITYLDNPATTSAVTYKTRGYNFNSGSTLRLNFSFGSTITLMEIGA